ncbi:MAG: alpha/beta hydrolase [Pseudomonadota bacterium]
MPIEYNIEEHRNYILKLQEVEKRLPARNIKILPIIFTLQDGAKLFSFIYRPNNLKNPPYPTVLHIRGTGYNASASYHDYLTSSHLAEESGCQLIRIEHRLAPEYTCPIGFQDVYTSYQLIIKYAEQLQIDKDKIAICGFSSGGNFSALTTIQAVKDKLPLALQILISPVTDLSLSLKKFASFEAKDSFPKKLAHWFIELYLHKNKHDPQNPTISPYWSNDLTNLPPTYILFGEFDRFRSHSEAYANKLANFGVWTHKSLFKNENHMMYWNNIRVLETIATQLKMVFNLTSLPKAISPLFFQKKYKKSSKINPYRIDFRPSRPIKL